MKIGANFKLVHYRKGEEIYDVTDTINLIESYFSFIGLQNRNRRYQRYLWQYKKYGW
jgi:hypothetical protein